MRMGALIPRYNLEALPGISISDGALKDFAYPSFLTILRKQSSMPL